MKNKLLEEILSEIIEDLKHKKVSDRVKSYDDLGSPYAILNNKVIVEVKLKKYGIMADIDITDLFEETLK